jgi:hypothetical protein
MEMKKIAKFTLWGAVGFGVGGAIGGAVASAFIGAELLAFPILGAIGGASLGLALKDWKRAVLLGLAGAIGFVGGQLLAFGVGYFIVLEHSRLTSLVPFIPGTVVGAIGGALLGLALKDWKGVGLLALAGVIGFNIAFPISYQGLVVRELYLHYILGWTIRLAIYGIIGGAFLGAALGYFEKRKAN